MPDLKRPTKRSLELAKQEWRKARAKMKDAGVILPNIDKVAAGKDLPEEGKEDLRELAVIRSIQNELESGVHYISPKATRGGQMAVRQSAERIKAIFDEALNRHGVHEAYVRLMEWAGTHDPLEYVRRLEQAVYDREFSHWAGGVAAYEREIAELAAAFDVEDIWAGLW